MFNFRPIQIPIQQRNAKGQFNKGCTSCNKGKKWDDWLSKEAQEKIKKSHSNNGRMDIGGWNKRAVLAIKDRKIVGYFESATDASKKTLITRRNITSVCQGKRKHAGGFQWFYEDEVGKWIKEIDNN